MNSLHKRKELKVERGSKKGGAKREGAEHTRGAKIIKRKRGTLNRNEDF